MAVISGTSRVFKFDKHWLSNAQSLASPFFSPEFRWRSYSACRPRSAADAGELAPSRLLGLAPYCHPSS